MSAVVVETRKAGGVSLGVILLEILPAALVVGLLAAVGIVHVSSRVMVVRVGYELSKLDAERTALIREQNALKLELATLTSPARLEPRARQELGLTPPPAGAVHTLRVK